MCNGIDRVAERTDLASRAILLNIPRITEGNRISSDILFQQFEALKPELLGVVFDLVSEILRKIEDTEITTNLRIIDVVKWASAAEELLGVPHGAIQEACERNYLEMTVGSLEDDPVSNAIINFMRPIPKWSGTKAQLLDLLDTQAGREGNELPVKVSAFAKALNRMKTSLRQVGIEIEDYRKSHQRSVTITNHNFAKGENAE